MTFEKLIFEKMQMSSKSFLEMAFKKFGRVLWVVSHRQLWGGFG